MGWIGNCHFPAGVPLLDSMNSGLEGRQKDIFARVSNKEQGCMTEHLGGTMVYFAGIYEKAQVCGKA